jgi:acyl carrier protein
MCSASLVARWAERYRFFNAYGPTEVTIWATTAECQDSSQVPTIGRPIANTEIYLLDQFLQPVPVGIPGQLFISGSGLARGYLSQPHLTAQRFLPHPFTTSPGQRLYQTGDLARYRPDGNIEFLGRLDHQVKIRGFRIELGEVESVLHTHPGVRECLVIARDDGDGVKRLVAYVVAEQQPTAGDSLMPELRRYLSEKLPDYMIPSAFVLMQQLPLMPSGKVDRRALPAPMEGRQQVRAEYLAPRTTAEEQLASIWREVLHVEKIGVEDNFFELGGHSLLATQVVSRAREAFGVELELRRLFEASTIAELAAAIEQIQQKVGSESREPTIVPLSRESYRVKVSSPAPEIDNNRDKRIEQ